MIPSVTLPTKKAEQLAKPISGIPLNQFQQLLYDWLIPIGVRLVMIDGSTEIQCLTGRPQAYAVLLPGKVYQFPFLRRL